MSDLEPLLREFPDLGYVLDEKVRKRIEIPPDVPFSGDLDYLNTVEVLCDLKHRVLEGRENLRNHLIQGANPRGSAGAGIDPDRLQALLRALERVRSLLDARIRARLAAAREPRALPRLERVARRLGLSDREIAAVQYMVLRHAGIRREMEDSIRFLVLFADLSPVELLEFVDPARLHMKQGLFDLESRLSPSRLDSDFRMADEWVKALCGGTLTGEEFLKIDRTALAEVLSEEPGFRPVPQGETGTPAGKGGKPARKEKGSGRSEDRHEDDEDQDDGDEDGQGEGRPHPGALPGGEGEGREMGDGESGMRSPEPAPPDSEGGKRRAPGGDFDLHEFLRDEMTREEAPKPAAGGEAVAEGKKSGEDEVLSAYATDLEYLQDHFRLVATRIKIRKTELVGESDYVSMRERSPESVLRELRALERVQSRKCDLRLQATRDAGARLPRLERLAESRGLEEFEKRILLTLVGARISYDVQKALEISGPRDGLGDVKAILDLWCSSLEERISRRRHFYKNATLVREGMIRLDDTLGSDLESCTVDIDRRMMDFLTGLDAESGELVDGSHLYTPRVRIEQVVLPRDQKQLILDTVRNFTTFGEVRRSLGFDDVISYGRSVVMLFYGPSGTGKTMMANALANHLEKKVLLINFPSLGGMQAGHVIRFLFREARIHDAILFFDECESIFESRAMDNPDISTLLTEIERHDSLVIMATNRPFDLDEAMHRRITLAIEFRQPDIHLREAIWRNHLPPALPLGPDVDLKALAMNFELSGGFIKNAVLSALSLAVARDGRTPRLRMEDLEKGARLQLRSRLRMADFDRRVVPSGGLDAVVVPPPLRRKLEEIVTFEKARSVLFGSWGFDEAVAQGQGTAALFSGPPGTGKSLAAEAIGYELGKALKVVNCAELLSKYVGDSAKNIEALFHDARNNDSVLVFDEAEGLFGARTGMGTSTDRYANIDVGLLLYHIERFPGIVILTTNLRENVDEALFRRLKFVLEFPVPDRALREALWKKLVPEKTPLAADVDMAALAARFELTGGHIKTAVFKAAARAALRPEDSRHIAMRDLVEAAEEEAAQGKPGALGFRTPDPPDRASREP
jgi:SpoVK/Ycf46/Vps4 family AAA+-type ATPase